MSYAPPPQVQYPYHRPPQMKNGLGVAALVLGIVALLLSFIPFVSLFTAIPLGATGAILAIIGLVRIGSGEANNRAVTIVGLVASLLAVVIAIASTVIAGTIVGSISNDSASSGSKPAQTSQPLSEATPEADEEEKEQFPGQTEDDVIGKPGEELEVKGLKMTAGKLKKTDSIFGDQLCSKVSIQNDGESTESYNAFEWKLQYPSGDTKDVTISDEDTLNSGEIAPGGKATGKVCFEGSSESGDFVLINEGFFDLSGKRAVWIDSRK